MIYTRGDFGVSVKQIDGFGKNPSLWIHYKNEAFKVASFKNEENAKLFISYLEWLLFADTKPPTEE